MPNLSRSATLVFPLLASLQAFADTGADLGAKIAEQGREAIHVASHFLQAPAKGSGMEES